MMFNWISFWSHREVARRTASDQRFQVLAGNVALKIPSRLWGITRVERRSTLGIRSLGRDLIAHLLLGA